MKLLIVDDEPLIHVSIEYNLRETGIGGLEVFHAYNGSEMLKKMESTMMDIVLVDIRMPGMNGLDAIAAARQQWPGTHYYIMSGFSEFEYAREAVRLGVAEYLLKPLDLGQLSEILLRVSKEKDQEASQVRESFRAWLVGTLHRHDVSSLFDPAYSAALVLFCCDSPDETALSVLLKQLVRYEKNMIIIPCWEGQLAMIYAMEKDRVREILHNIADMDFPKGITSFETAAGNSVSDLVKAMHKLLDFSPLRVFHGIGRHWKLNQFTETGEMFRAKEWIELRDCFWGKRYADFVTKSTALIPTLSVLSTTEMKHLAEYLQSFTGVKIPAVYSAERIGTFLNDTGESMIRRESGGERIDGILEYIRENFCEDISINRLSMQFDLSPNYLSTLFKKRLGVNFVDYLTSLRLARAKELLISTNLSVREIGESVGWYSQSYFTKIFIRKEGCTPGEFKRRLSKDPEN